MAANCERSSNERSIRTGAGLRNFVTAGMSRRNYRSSCSSAHMRRRWNNPAIASTVGWCDAGESTALGTARCMTSGNLLGCDTPSATMGAHAGNPFTISKAAMANAVCGHGKYPLASSRLIARSSMVSSTTADLNTVDNSRITFGGSTTSPSTSKSSCKSLKINGFSPSA